MPQVDPELFDRGQFQAELALKASPIAAFKKAIRHAREVLDGRFTSGRDVRRLVEDRAWFVDQILREAWDRLSWSEDADIALLAVGGYGRGELHPFSDIDLLILLDNADHETFREPIERFLTLLWDIGLEVGQSVRSVDECAEEARADLTVITNLMESRTIAGPERLRQRMQAVTSTEQMWPSKQFFLAKHKEQRARHGKYNDTEYNLEPNVKGSPGGLRDIQTILWVARRQYGTLNLHALAGEGCQVVAFTEGERREQLMEFFKFMLGLIKERREQPLGFDIVSPGVLAPEPLPAVPGRYVTTWANKTYLDSLAIEANGNIAQATLIESAGITSIDPVTGAQEYFPFPDLLTTNICFGGDDMMDAWVCLSTTGKLVSIDWPRAVDVNDRGLRNIITGLGGRVNGAPRETGFVITAASEMMRACS
mgnify:CR=1 FL=1